jgi:hypothetical protein
MMDRLGSALQVAVLVRLELAQVAPAHTSSTHPPISATDVVKTAPPAVYPIPFHATAAILDHS